MPAGGTTIEGDEAARARSSLARRRGVVAVVAVGVLAIGAGLVFRAFGSGGFDGPPDLEVQVGDQTASLESKVFDWCDDHGRELCVSQDAETPYGDVVLEAEPGSLVEVASAPYGNEGPTAFLGQEQEVALQRGPDGDDRTSFVVPDLPGRHELTIVAPGSSGTPAYGLTLVVAEPL